MRAVLLAVWMLLVASGLATIVRNRRIGPPLGWPPPSKPRLDGTSQLAMAVAIAPIAFEFRIGSPNTTRILQFVIVFVSLVIYALSLRTPRGRPARS